MVLLEGEECNVQSGRLSIEWGGRESKVVCEPNDFQYKKGSTVLDDTYTNVHYA